MDTRRRAAQGVTNVDVARSIVGRIASTDCGERVELSESDRRGVVDLLLEELPVFLHPLGFLHLELTEVCPRSPDYDRVRVHYFIREYEKRSTSPSLAHSHTWFLKSCPVLGHLVNHRFEFRSEPDGELELATLHYHEDGSESFGEPIVGKINPIDSTPIDETTVYCHTAGDLHRTQVASEIAVTILATLSTTTDAQVVLSRFSTAPAQEKRQVAGASAVASMHEALRREVERCGGLSNKFSRR